MMHTHFRNNGALATATCNALRVRSATAILISLPLTALADPTPAPSLPIPSGILNSPIVQGALNALGGLTQTTNGATAFGKVTYFTQFDLQMQTAPSVYRKIR